MELRQVNMSLFLNNWISCFRTIVNMSIIFEYIKIKHRKIFRPYSAELWKGMYTVCLKRTLKVHFMVGWNNYIMWCPGVRRILTSLSVIWLISGRRTYKGKIMTWKCDIILNLFNIFYYWIIPILISKRRPISFFSS